MKRIFLFLALALLAVSVSAQNRYYYDSGKKYGFLSNWTLGVSGQYSNQHGVSNVGITALATKRVGDYWRLRYEASINGLRCVDGFDRYGTAMAGAAFDFLNWMYLFADAGAVVNPTMATKFGLAADAGLGLNVNFGKHSMLWLEGGSDLVQNNAALNNTFFVRLGYGVRTGITERDRVDIDITRHNAEQLGTLTEENRLLKTDKKRLQEANDTLMAIQNKSLEMLARLEKRLDDCNAQVVKATQTGAVATNSFSQIFFAKGSAEITPIEAAKVKQLANYINSTDGDFRIEGYASPEGSLYVNEELCGERARAVYWMLIDLGVDIDRLIPMTGGVTTLYGEDSPLNRMVVATKSAL
jgi:outer membrane protein OmpA-like peptidoglycan-associated protein